MSGQARRVSWTFGETLTRAVEYWSMRGYILALRSVSRVGGIQQKQLLSHRTVLSLSLPQKPNS